MSMVTSMIRVMHLPATGSRAFQACGSNRLAVYSLRSCGSQSQATISCYCTPVIKEQSSHCNMDVAVSCDSLHLSCDDILKFDWCCQLSVNLISLVSRLVWWLPVSCVHYKCSGDSTEADIECLQYTWLNTSVWQESIVLNGGAELTTEYIIREHCI